MTALALLTAREREMLELISDGLSNEGIACRLNVSIKTVEAICRAIFFKLGLSDTSQMENRRVKAAVAFLRSRSI